MHEIRYFFLFAVFHRITSFLDLSEDRKTQKKKIVYEI